MKKKKIIGLEKEFDKDYKSVGFNYGASVNKIYGRWQEKGQYDSDYEATELNKIKRPFYYLYFDILFNNKKTSYQIAKLSSNTYFLLSLPLFFISIALNFVYKQLYLSKFTITGSAASEYSILLGQWLDTKTMYWVIIDLFLILILPLIFYVVYAIFTGETKIKYIFSVFFCALIFHILFNHLAKILIILTLVPVTEIQATNVHIAGVLFSGTNEAFNGYMDSFTMYSNILYFISVLLMANFISRNITYRNDTYYSINKKEFVFQDLMFNEFAGKFIGVVMFFVVAYLFLLSGNYGFF